MNKRIAKKIVKNEGKLNYTASQLKTAKRIVNKRVKK